MAWVTVAVNTNCVTVINANPNHTLNYGPNADTLILILIYKSVACVTVINANPNHNLNYGPNADTLILILIYKSVACRLTLSAMVSLVSQKVCIIM